MTSDVQVFTKDSIKLNILQDVLSGLIKLSLKLGDKPAEDYASSIHEDGKRVQVFGKFNISEDPSGEILTIRPIMVDAPLTLLLNSNASFSGKSASIVRSKTKAVECEFEISSQTTNIELQPQGRQSYTLRVSNGSVSAKASSTASAEAAPERSPRIQPTIAAPTTETTSVQPSVQSQQTIQEEIVLNESQTASNDGFQGFDLDAGFGLQDDRFASFDIGADTVISPTVTPSVDSPAMVMTQRTEEVVRQEQPVAEHADNGSDPELARIEQEISVIERQQGQLSQKKQSAIDHLEKIEAEYKKDYESLETELEEVKSRMEADEAIIEHYKDQDVMPIEVIFQEIRLKLEEAEAQIRFFIEAKQKKTMEIESEIKANRGHSS